MALFLPQTGQGPSVVDLGADPTGGADSTAAFQTAISSTGASEAIRVPGGVYLLDAATVLMQNRMWIGDVSNAGRPQSVLRARTSAVNFLTISSRTYFENLIFDANFLCDRALVMSSAHNSILWNVECRDANEYGLFSNETNVAAITRLTCRNSANGARFQGANGVSILDMRILNNTGFGVEFIGVLSGETAKSGQVSVFGFECAGNEGGPAVRVDGVTNGFICGGQVSGAGDGLVLEDATNMLLSGLRIEGDGSGGEAAIRASAGSKLCTFESIQAVGSNAAFERAVIVEPAQVMQFYGCHKADGSALDLVYTDGVTSYTASPNGANLKATGAPTAGQFLRGHIAWNGSPTALSNRGWRCTAAGAPGTWASF